MKEIQVQYYIYISYSYELQNTFISKLFSIQLKQFRQTSYFLQINQTIWKDQTSYQYTFKYGWIYYPSYVHCTLVNDDRKFHRTFNLTPTGTGYRTTEQSISLSEDFLAEPVSHSSVCRCREWRASLNVEVFENFSYHV